ncbi:MAG: excinuclease ABC subunit UvrC [Chloroflexi bacterium]|nr:excinuclease ABC subunit UvrC [Chloroflexota bacterium]
MNLRKQIQTRLAGLPDKPGVYIMRDAQHCVIYVGKAISLRNRVRSYFHESAGHTPKTERLVGDIADLEWIVTGSELEALVLECELIKRYRPRYNVRLKDDKRYPYIKVTLQEDFPRVLVVRRMQHDGARYFGPFTSSQAVYQSLDLLRRLFPYRTCNREIDGHDRRPCLYYHIKRCPGPCIGAATREEYREIIYHACLFLDGKHEEIIPKLEAEMAQEAERLHFEEAARLRDQIEAIKRVIERQRIISGHLKDHDFLAFARENGQACVQVFFVRGGKLIGREYFVLTGTQDEAEEEVMASFIKQFYDEAAYIPPEILVPADLDELGVIQEWLRQKRGHKTVIKVPRRGEKREIMTMATENALETLNKLRAEWEADKNKQVEALQELQGALGLAAPPARIECYDISTTQGQLTTGSMVVFVHGVPSKQDYRRFRIKTVQGSDDYAAMAEVLRRRFARLQQDEVKWSVQGERPAAENRWAILPDLVLIDGGKGQLNAALQAMAEMGVDHIPVAGLAKREEALFVPGRSAPILLPRNAQGLYLLQRIRDEAHRFAVSYHRKLRQKQGVKSFLDGIPGIGPKRRQALLDRFGSLEAIRQASVEELAAVPGMTRKAAEEMVQYL